MDSHDSFTIGWSLGAAIISAMNITYTEELDASAMQLVTRPSSFVATVTDGDGRAGAPLCDLVDDDAYVPDSVSSSLTGNTDDATRADVDGDVDHDADDQEVTADASSSICRVRDDGAAAAVAASDDGAF